MKTTEHKTLTFFSGLVLCTIAGLAALVLTGCDEIDQIADNASKRPPNCRTKSGAGLCSKGSRLSA